MNWPATGCSMQLKQKFRSLRRLNWDDRLLIGEASVMLGVARILVLTVPFRHIAAGLRWMPQSDARDDGLEGRVRQAVGIAARNVPWNAVCLPQAIAAKAMLA